MTKIESEKLSINASAEKIYHFLSDFNHFEHLMPEQVKEWTADEESCKFNVTGISEIGMRIKEKDPNKRILIQSEKPSPIKFDLKCEINENEQNSTEVQLAMDAKLNPFVKMVAEKPLENLLNMMIEKLKEYFESTPS